MKDIEIQLEKDIPSTLFCTNNNPSIMPRPSDTQPTPALDITQTPLYGRPSIDVSKKEPVNRITQPQIVQRGRSFTREDSSPLSPPQDADSEKIAQSASPHNPRKSCNSMGRELSSRLVDALVILGNEFGRRHSVPEISKKVDEVSQKRKSDPTKPKEKERLAYDATQPLVPRLEHEWPLGVSRQSPTPSSTTRKTAQTSNTILPSSHFTSIRNGPQNRPIPECEASGALVSQNNSAPIGGVCQAPFGNSHGTECTREEEPRTLSPLDIEIIRGQVLRAAVPGSLDPDSMHLSGSVLGSKSLRTFSTTSRPYVSAVPKSLHQHLYSLPDPIISRPHSLSRPHSIDQCNCCHDQFDIVSVGGKDPGQIDIPRKKSIRDRAIDELSRKRRIRSRNSSRSSRSESGRTMSPFSVGGEGCNKRIFSTPSSPKRSGVFSKREPLGSVSSYSAERVVRYSERKRLTQYSTISFKAEQFIVSPENTQSWAPQRPQPIPMGDNSIYLMEDTSLYKSDLPTGRYTDCVLAASSRSASDRYSLPSYLSNTPESLYRERDSAIELQPMHSMSCKELNAYELGHANGGWDTNGSARDVLLSGNSLYMHQEAKADQKQFKFFQYEDEGGEIKRTLMIFTALVMIFVVLLLML